jgi:sodium/bile acid cotransporter 7
MACSTSALRLRDRRTADHVCIESSLQLITSTLYPHPSPCRKLFKLPLLEAISVFVMSSQKSAPVAVTVISYITSVPATQGLLAIPCVVGQISQIFIGSGIARYFVPQVQRYKQELKQKEEAAAAAAAAAAGDVESPEASSVAAAETSALTAPAK